MIHFTFTGLNAGILICGKPREDAQASGEKLEHIPSTSRAGSLRHDACEGCLKVYTRSFKEDDGSWEEGTPDWVKEV